MTSKTNYQMNSMNTNQKKRVGCTDGGPDLESPSRKKRKINVNKNRKKGEEIRRAGAARGCVQKLLPLGRGREACKGMTKPGKPEKS